MGGGEREQTDADEYSNSCELCGKEDEEKKTRKRRLSLCDLTEPSVRAPPLKSPPSVPTLRIGQISKNTHMPVHTNTDAQKQRESDVVFYVINSAFNVN